MGLIERFVAASLRQRLFVLICLAALIATGTFAYRELPVEAFPDLTNNQVTVVTEASCDASLIWRNEIEVSARESNPNRTSATDARGHSSAQNSTRANIVACIRNF